MTQKYFMNNQLTMRKAYNVDQVLSYQNLILQLVISDLFAMLYDLKKIIVLDYIVFVL